MKFATYFDRTARGRDIVIQVLAARGEVPRHELEHSVLLATGLGQRWLNEFLRLLEKMGQVCLTEDSATWVKGGAE